MTSTAPNLAEFRASALDHFAYLISDYGFTVDEVPPQRYGGFIVYFYKPDVFVAVIGLSYGWHIDVELGQPDRPGRPEVRVHLGHVVQLRQPHLLEPRYGGAKGQIEEMRLGASYLQACAVDFLSGDFSAFPTVQALVACMANEAAQRCQQLELAQASAKAKQAFKAGAHKDAVRILQPFEKLLTPAQKKLLLLARKGQ